MTKKWAEFIFQPGIMVVSWVQGLLIVGKGRILYARKACGESAEREGKER